MKKLLLVMILLMMPFVSAEIEHYTTKVNVSLANNVFSVETEDRQIRTYSSSSSFNDNVITINLYRNTSCREDQLYDFLQRGCYDNNQTLICQRRLTECQTDLTDTMSLTYFATNVSYRTKFETCSNQVTTFQSQLANLQNQGPALSQCQQDLNKSKSDADSTKYMWAAAGLALGYFLWGRKPFASSPTSSLPPSR